MRVNDASGDDAPVMAAATSGLTKDMPAADRRERNDTDECDQGRPQKSSRYLSRVALLCGWLVDDQPLEVGDCRPWVSALSCLGTH